MANLLASVMSSAQSAQNAAMSSAASKKQRPKAETDPNQAVLRSIADKALAEGNLSRIEAIAPELRGVGINPDIYLKAGNVQTPEEQFMQGLIGLFTGQPQQPAPSGQPTTATAAAPSQTFDSSAQASLTPTPYPQQSEQTPSTSRPAPVDPERVGLPAWADQLDDDTKLRMIVKKISGIDIGTDYTQNKQWFADFGQLQQQNVPVTEAVNRLAAEYGFLPEGASSLKGLSADEQNVIFGKEFSRYFDDPVVNAALGKAYPGLVDRQSGKVDPKVKTGLILNELEKEGRVIPAHYQPFLDRFRGLADLQEGGALPSGYRWQDPNAPRQGVEPIPGSAEERRIAEEDRIKRVGVETKAKIAQTVYEDIALGMGILDDHGWLAAGPAASMSAIVSTSPAGRLDARIQSIRGNTAIDTLLRIKESGAGLGQVPQAQLNMLAAVMGSLSIAMHPDDLRFNLRRVQEIYAEIVETAGGDPIALFGDRYERITGERLPDNLRWRAGVGAAAPTAEQPAPTGANRAQNPQTGEWFTYTEANGWQPEKK